MYGLQDLEKLLREKLLTSVKLVIVSACHSIWIAKKFAKAGIQSVIGISASRKVEEKAAQDFNVNLIKVLMEGRSVDDAFAIAQSKVSKLNRTCCCDHAHTE